MSLADDVRAGLAELGELDPRDRAVATLAVTYAERIDDALAFDASTERGRPDGWQDTQRDPLAELGPKLLAALKELGMTPAARKALIADATPPVKPTSKLDELLARRAARRAP